MSNSKDQHEFARLYAEIEDDLYRYVRAAVLRHADALDVLQETAMALWQKFGEYDRARPFGPWARKFVHVQVLKYRLYKKLPSGRSVTLSQAAIEAVHAEYEQHSMVIDMRLSALHACLDRLESEDRRLLDWRYWDNVNLRTTAADADTSEDQLYKRLGRIRRDLAECIDRTLAEEA